MKTISTAEKQNVDLKPSTVLLDSNDIRSRFLTTQPTVKILKRPSESQATGDQSHATCVNGSAAPQRKSLQQREMEYAEARLRILGQAQSPEEKEPTFQERVRQIQNKPTPPSASNNVDQPPSNHISTTTSTLSPQSPVFISHNHFATGTTTILTTPVHYATSPYYAVLPPHHMTIGANMPPPVGNPGAMLAPAKFVPSFSNQSAFRSAQVIRQPRGPDGTRGFQFHQPR
ncbi:uncharacterized protein LOC111048272 isoform X2 [Nilaparvata lugens]|nr:uncharacterized protein LOC111048272 isoform X2 [Nilaparvata lugens]